MQKFVDDDAGYLAWVAAHPSAFVLNVRRSLDPSYVVLHRSWCGAISTGRRRAGAYTARGYRKLCVETAAELRRAAVAEGRQDGSFSLVCGLCKPL